MACFGNSEVSTLEIDEEAWARDYFQVASDKVQERLAQYLILPDIRTTMPPDIKSADTAEQLAWATDKAVQELSAFVAKELSRLAAWDITSGHSDPDTAATIVQHFRKGSSHAVDRWSNASTALAIMTAMFTALGLNKSETDLDSIVTAVLRAMDIAEGKPGRSPEQYEQDSNSLHAQVGHFFPNGPMMAVTYWKQHQQYARSIAFGSVHSNMHNSMMIVQRTACTACMICTEMASHYDLSMLK